MRLAIACFVASLPVSATAQQTQSLPAALVLTPIFGELFAHSVPSGFRAQREQTGSDTYMRTMLLALDSDLDWKQRILITGTKRPEQLPSGFGPKAFAMNFARSFQQSCPTTFSGGAIAEAKLSTGHAAYFMLVSCGSHALTPTRAPTSESALIAVVQGDLNFYSLQWSERGPPVGNAPEPNVEVWHSRLKAITPLLVCAHKPEESAPYASCSDRKVVSDRADR
jgi:hypothetical protein